MEKPLFNYMKESMDNLSHLLARIQIVGEPITLDDGGILIPVSQVSFGFGNGGAEGPLSKKKVETNVDAAYPFANLTIGGVTMKPKAFLYIHYDVCTIIDMDKEKNTYQKALELFLSILKKKMK